MNLRIIKYLILVLILIISTSSFSQITKSFYFSDTTNSKLDFVYDYLEVEDGIILSGRQKIRNKVEPVMLKLDLSGEVVWSTLSSFHLGKVKNNGFLFEMFDDGYIYAVSYMYDSNITTKILWKINPTNGNVIWTKQHPSTNFGVIDMVDYDSTTFLTSAIVDDYGTLLKMDKATGDTLESINFNSSESSMDVAVDANKNIYFSQDYIVRKFNLNDFHQLIWSRSYPVNGNKNLFVQHMYIDYLGELYLFGHDGGSYGAGNGLYLKVDEGNGNKIWMTVACQSEVNLADFKDYNGKIYGTFRHAFVGGGTYQFKTSQVDKITGKVDWYSNENVKPLGKPSSTSGYCQSALSIDVACDGSIYLTGYYGDANYGPERWGIMKLKGNTGVRDYDLTITQDSINYEDLSSGIATCVIGNTPIFIGHEEDTSSTYNVNPVFVTIDPVKGDIVNRKYIKSGYELLSRTLDIINHNDSIYVFKQEGASLVVEQYNSLGKLLWSKVVVESESLTGGNIIINGDYIYFTAIHGVLEDFQPFNIKEYREIVMVKMKRKNGSIVKYDKMKINTTPLKLIDLQAKNDTAFFFYEKNNQVYFNRWNAGLFSNERLLQNSTLTSSFGGRSKNIIEYDSINYLFIGSNGLYKLDKNLLIQTKLAPINGNRKNYYIIENKNILYLAGSDSLGFQTITAIDKTSLKVYWDKAYSDSGVFYKIVTNNIDKLWVLGSKKDLIEVHEIDMLTGNSNWNYPSKPINYYSTFPLDIALHPTKNKISVVGYEGNGIDKGNVFIDILDTTGSNITTIVTKDELGLISKANTVTYTSDSVLWVGGTLNSVSNGSEGFIYLINNTSNTNSIEIIEKPWIVSAYPNPTNSFVTFKGLNEPHQIEVYDYIGRKILCLQTNDTTTIDFENFAPAIYVVNVHTKEYSQSFKIMKQ
jgi:hypothetical protein